MLNFMGYDVTEDTENETSAGDAFVIRRWEPAASDFRYSEMQYKELEQKFELPPLFGLLKLVCGYGAVMMLFGILRLGNPVQGFRREPAYFVVFGICLAGWLGLLLWEKTRPKQVISSPDYQAMAAEARAFLDKGKQALGVPDSVIQAAVETVKALQPFEEIDVTRAGCTVSSHCGPGTIGVLFIHTGRF